MSLALLLTIGCGHEPAGPVELGPAPRASLAAAPGPQEPESQADCCEPETPAEVATATEGAAHPQLPDIPLVTHRGAAVHFHRDLVRGRVVALNFIFTSCKGVCPPLGTNFAALSHRMRDHLGKDLAMISVSVDPVNDTPDRLAEWSRRFDPDPGWTLVTGRKHDVDRLLKALGVYAADKTQHSPFILLGDESSGTWSRLHGLTPPARVATTLEAMLLRHRPGPSAPSGATEPRVNESAQRYFTDVVLVDQDGHELRLYSDLMRGKVVVIQSFFCSCKAACPKLVSNFMAIQERFRDRMGKDLHLLSISVDPTRDTVDTLRAFARRNGAGPGWYFLTGRQENVELALHKFGQKVDAPDNHSNLFMIGNDATELWKKAMGLAQTEDLIQVVASVLDDPGPN
jgi:cytochrome oxidase Cu insertion factor (SCO1/SenC/PrrC family)